MKICKFTYNIALATSSCHFDIERVRYIEALSASVSDIEVHPENIENIENIVKIFVVR